MKKITLIILFTISFLAKVYAAGEDRGTLNSSVAIEVSTYIETTDVNECFRDVDSDYGDNNHAQEDVPFPQDTPTQKTIYEPLWDDNRTFSYAKFLWHSIDSHECQQGTDALKKIASDYDNEFNFEASKILFSSVYQDNQNFAVPGLEFYAKCHLLDESLEAKTLLWQSLKHYKKVVPFIEGMVEKYPHREDVLSSVKLMYYSYIKEYKEKSIKLIGYLVLKSKNKMVKDEATRLRKEYFEELIARANQQKANSKFYWFSIPYVYRWPWTS